MAYYNSLPTIPDARRNGFPSVQDDRRNDYLTKQAGDQRNGFKTAEYEGSPFMEVPLPESKPPPPGWFSYVWTIPGSYWNSWLSSRSTIPRLEGGSNSAGGIQRPPTFNRNQDSETNYRSYGNIDSRGVNGAHLGKVDNTSRGIDDHQRFPARNEAHIDDLEVRFKEKETIQRLDNRIKHLEKCMKDLESDFIVKTKSYYVEKMRADDFEKVNRECQEKLKGLSLEKMRADKLEKENRDLLGKLRALYSETTRADALAKENREYQGKLQGLQSEKMRGDNLERENSEYQAKLQMKEREVGELQLKLQAQTTASSAAAAALEVRDAELKILQNSFQDVRRENQELKSWKLEQEGRIENDMSTTGELNTKVSELTTAHDQSEKQKQQLATNVQEQAKRIQELKQLVSVLELKMAAKDSEAQSLRERLREERVKSSNLSDALQQKNSQIEEIMQLAQDLEQRNNDLMAKAVPAANSAQGDDKEPRERELNAQFSALQAQIGSKESETLSLKVAWEWNGSFDVMWTR
ncbi:hypothetical protein KC19_12G072600 [Ceratodon purpureus]|uniref:Uncharacterized protein n=1 Tax=Ceratodon purpureus TaxID=3225 RepID=A0A8T0G5T4_CERPU|nr:hypothetical protein KC19_12G072600 [Ceratodon purpureus]